MIVAVYMRLQWTYDNDIERVIYYEFLKYDRIDLGFLVNGNFIKNPWPPFFNTEFLVL